MTARATWHELDVAAGGVRLHVRRLEMMAPPLLLLHGLGVSGAVWQAFARRLAPHWSAIAPDLRGHGSSDRPPHGYEPVDYARDVAALLTAVGVEQAPAVGHSLGALVALALASLEPERLPALVLLDPPLDPRREHPDVPAVYRLRHAPAGELERFLARNGTPALVARSMAALFRQAADAAFEAHLAAPRGAPWAWQAAERIRQPVLLLQADPAHGGVLGDVAAQAFVARLPQGRLVKLPGAPHALHASHPAQVARAIVAFLQPFSRGSSAGGTPR
jgi:pimeloyl-ACP methyl ester carboxylesterase